MTEPNLSTDDDFVEIKDFTIKRRRIRFKVDNDVFEARPVLGLSLMQKMVKLGQTISSTDGEEKFEEVFKIFDQLLLPESAKLFRQRGMSIDDDAIDMRQQLIPILYYLLEAYGVRPTQLSSDSLSG